MASKINPKGIFKSNSRSKGPNPKGINPGGINNKPAPKPAVKSPVKPVASKPVTSTTTPRTRGGASKGNTPGTGTKYSGKTPINNNKPVSQGRGGVSKGNTPGVSASKRKALADLKARTNERLATEKAAAQKSTTGVPRTRGGASRGVKVDPLKQPKEVLKKTLGKNTGRAGVTKGNQAAIKIAKVAKLAKFGKKAAIVAGAGALGFGAGAGIAMIKNAYNKKDSDKKDTKKPEVKKDDTKKPKVEDKPKVGKKDKWGRPESSKWYGFNPKTQNYESPVTSNKKDERTGSLGKDIIKAGEKANASRKTKAEDNFKDLTPKKKETKPVVKKPVTPATPKADTKVDKMETKPIAPIATDLESKKEIIQPKATATTPSASSSSTSTTTPSSSASAPKTQPRATFGNKIRGVLNASRERRAERAEARGNEGRADKLRDKIEDTSKKMVMRKGGTVKKSKKK